VPAWCGRDLPAESLCEPVSDLLEEGQALLADEKPDRPSDPCQYLAVGQGQLIG